MVTGVCVSFVGPTQFAAVRFIVDWLSLEV